MTFGSACTAAGAPSAIFWPKSSTVTVSQMHITTSMWCSIRITVMPCSRILRDDRDQLLDVGRGQAGGRLVEQQQLRVERQRAGDLEQPLLAVRQVARFLVRQRRRGRRSAAGPARARSRAGSRAGSAACAARRRRRWLSKLWCRPTITFCSAVISPNSWTFWKVRAMPDSAMSDERAADDRARRRTRCRRRSARRCRSARSSSCSCPSRSGRSARGRCRAGRAGRRR